MRNTKWLAYFGYAITLLGYIIFFKKILVYQYNIAKATFNLPQFWIYSVILHIVLGFILGLERLISEIKKEGSWKINIPKLIFLGIPFLYFSLSTFVYFIPIEFLQLIFSYPLSYILDGNINFVPIFQIIFGYTICTSFIKVKN